MRYQDWEQASSAGISAAEASEFYRIEAIDAEAELMERGAAEKPMAEQVTAMAEEFIVDGALTELMRGDIWHSLLLTDRDTATTMMEGAMVSMAKLYDKGMIE